MKKQTKRAPAREEAVAEAPAEPVAKVRVETRVSRVVKVGAVTFRPSGSYRVTEAIRDELRAAGALIEG